MLKGTFLSGVIFTLLLSIIPMTSIAADDDLTAQEEQLWNDFFGEEVKPNAQTSQYPSGDSQSNISGLWIGYYEYDKPQGQPEGMFSAIIRDLGDKFLITFLEPKRSADEYAQWAGNTTAKRQGQYIEFVKQYQSAENKTEVEYNLTISHQGAIMSGTWSIDNNTYGRAFFYRADLDNLKSIKAEATH